MTKPQSVSVDIKPSLLHKKYNLTINADFIRKGKKQFSRNEIAAIRYGIKAIKGYRIRIGRIYCIDIQNKQGEVIKIRIKSIYRIRIKQLDEKYSMILQALFTNFIKDIIEGLLNDFKNETAFTILGVKFTKEGIVLNKPPLIAWLDLGAKDYWHYFSLFSNENPNHYKTFQYLTDWNTIVLHRVSKAILQSKKLL